MIYVVGHKSPDTDSVASAIVLSDYLNKKGLKSKPAINGKLNNESKFVLSLAKREKPQEITKASNKKFFLVDHGSLDQSVDGLEEEAIIGVLDHHKMSGIATDRPIFYRSEPVGSTASLVFILFSEAGIELNKSQKILLLSAIISDTLKFTSPTTTKEDEKIARFLAKETGLRLSDLAKKMFQAKSDISGMRAKDILMKDFKEFKLGKIDIGVGVHETVLTAPVQDMKKEIFEEIDKMKKSKDLIFFAVIDILKKESLLYLSSEKEKKVAQKVFKGKISKDNIMILPGVVSRKKQIIPPLSEALK